jgi:hypothetical protein
MEKVSCSIRCYLGRKWMQANALAYSAREVIKKKKVFIFIIKIS